MDVQKAILILAAITGFLCPATSAWPQVGQGWQRITPSVVLHHAAYGHLYTAHPVPHYFDDGLAHYDNDGAVETFILYKAASNRIEIRVENNYDSGMKQFEGWVWVDAPTDNESIMQVFGGTTHATAAMFRAGFNINGGELRHGDHHPLVSGIYRTWTRLNVIHNADAGTISAYTNGRFVGQWKDNGHATHYFKYGAYGTHDDAHPAVVKWKNVSIFYQ
jgi:hypothetical protein